MKQFLISKGHNGYLAEIKEGGFHVFGNFSSLVTFLEKEFEPVKSTKSFEELTRNPMVDHLINRGKQSGNEETQGSAASEPSSDTTVPNQEP